ncbi:MAG: peptidoglycan-associated lipoprotein Pal [Desulfobacterales bacterium]|nr:peptidoglycan-associated lipoprotein Pal [Desulfobacterales bacterium]
MWRKLLTCLIAMAFVCSSLLLATGCAKKQIQDSEGTVGTGRAETAEVKKVRAFESASIYFDFDKSVLMDEAKDNLKEKAGWLKKNSSYSILIEGHCDNRGTSEYNMALGERRAYSAKKFLMALGIAETRISTVTYGEEKPADPRENEEGWALNRRDEFKVNK